MIEVWLALYCCLIWYNIWKSGRITKELKLLEAQNKQFEEAMLLPEFPESEQIQEDYVKHNWQFVGTEIIYSSPFSTSVVKLQTHMCSECRMVSRQITEGYNIAVMKKIHRFEGMYLNGFKCVDTGCKKVEK